MSSFSTDFIAALANTAALAKNTPWHYGNSQSLPPCADGYISCDRLVSRSLWDMGYHNQPAGGWVSAQLPAALQAIGFTRVTDRRLLVPGSVVIVGLGSDPTYHTFAITAYDPATDLCDKYDMGSGDRIQDPQPYRDVPLVQWPDRYFSMGFLPPDTPGPGGRSKAWLYFRHAGWRANNGCSCFIS